jgi:hypothetical protein
VVVILLLVVIIIIVINDDDDDDEDHVRMDRFQRNGIWSWGRLVKYSLFPYP